MEIREVYKKFNIPPNLAEHMINVASVLELIKENWQGEKIDWARLIRAGLLHDLGNIVKFDMDKYPDFMGEEKGRIDYWKKVQEEIIEKYGEDDHEVTEKMLKEIGEDLEVVEIVLDKSFWKSIEIVEGEDLETKLLLYADLRTGPLGLMTLKERVDDINDRMPKYSKRPDFPEMVESIYALGREIGNNLKIPVEEINDENIEKFKENFKN